VGLLEDVSYRFSKWDENDRENTWAARRTGAHPGFHAHRPRPSGNSGTRRPTRSRFYGPKLDIQIRNVFGKEDTLITIQVDFQLAEVFA
jgi:threonyl-tRNA synthetase